MSEVQKSRKKKEDPTVREIKPREVVSKEETSGPLDRIVRGIFKNIESPGCSHTFSFKNRKGEPIRTYTMEDGEEYEVPLSVADHLNKNCSYPVHRYLLDAQGMPAHKAIEKMVHRFAFQPLGF